MKAWARLLEWVPASVATVVAGYLADWQTAAVTGSCAFLGARVVVAMASRAITAKFVAEVEGSANDAELALAARVGLDVETLQAAKAAVRAAVRAEMVRRGAGVAGLAKATAVRAALEAARAAPSRAADAGSRPAADAAWAAEQAAEHESPEQVSASQVVTGARRARRDDVD